MSHTADTETRAEKAYRVVSTFWTAIRASLRELGASLFDLLKSAPKWFLLLVIAGSTAFGSGSATIAGMFALDSLSRIERDARDRWQRTLAEQAEEIGTLKAVSRQHSDEFERRAKADAEFRQEIRREFDRLNFRLSQKGR